MRTYKGTHYVARLNFDRWEKGMMDAAKEGLEQAAIWLTGQLKRDLSKPGPFPAPVSKQERERRQELASAAGLEHRASRPGEPPRYRTGALRASVANEARWGGMVQRVGTPLKYGFWLEWGTPRMSPRPWLRPGLRRNASKLAEFVLNAVRG